MPRIQCLSSGPLSASLGADVDRAVMTCADRLLIYAPVPLFRDGGRLFMEAQACNGLRLWAENFEYVTSLHPVIEGPVPEGWKPVETIGANLARIQLIPLPTAYRPDQFLRCYRATRELIRAEIGKARYLSFSIGGLLGDWGSVACWQAHCMGRPYAVWTDRVESEVVRRTALRQPWRRKLRAQLEHRPMGWWEKFIIRRATLGLFHGKDTYDAYARFARKAALVHDIHLSKANHISAKLLQAKIAGLGAGPIRIVYAGRATAMKAPQDWLSVLEGLADAGVDFKATWLGDGPELPSMKARVEAHNLSSHITFTGFVDDRTQVMAQLRDAHIFLFCHTTPESPRSLIEALISGTPIVGYESAFAQDLIAQHGGGRLVSLKDAAALLEAVTGLAQDKSALSRLIGQAARDGAPFDDESVFQHRSAMIRQSL